MEALFDECAKIHRHTGGLENFTSLRVVGRVIHRHTGGLEKIGLIGVSEFRIHRHTGGLES